MCMLVRVACLRLLISPFIADNYMSVEESKQNIDRWVAHQLRYNESTNVTPVQFWSHINDLMCATTARCNAIHFIGELLLFLVLLLVCT